MLLPFRLARRLRSYLDCCCLSVNWEDWELRGLLWGVVLYDFDWGWILY